MTNRPLSLCPVVPCGSVLSSWPVALLTSCPLDPLSCSPVCLLSFRPVLYISPCPVVLFLCPIVLLTCCLGFCLSYWTCCITDGLLSVNDFYQ